MRPDQECLAGTRADRTHLRPTDNAGTIGSPILLPSEPRRHTETQFRAAPASSARSKFDGIAAGRLIPDVLKRCESLGRDKRRSVA
jgi:hypothetical protein